MKTSIVEIVMIAMIKQELKINTIRAKMRRLAAQSTLCKVYFKLIKSVRAAATKNTVTVKPSKIGGCVEIVANSTRIGALKVGSILAFKHIEAFKSIYSLNVEII